MRSIFPTIVAVLLYTNSYAQLLINEVDVDNPSIDTQEFVELIAPSPFQTIQNMVLVFFNGSNSESYYAIDLDGYQTDINGLLVVGSRGISPVPQIEIPDNKIQNGPDAIAVYNGGVSDFPNGTLASTANLVDVLVYGTNDNDATNLMQLLGETIQYNEGASGNTNSLQLQADGSYVADVPSPRQLNDGSGVQLIGLTISTASLVVDEGDEVVLTFELDQPAEAQLEFTVSYSYGTFNTSDYSAAETIVIAENQTLSQTTITLIDDLEDEGDEEMFIEVGNLPDQYVKNNTLLIRVNDNDFNVEDWGAPVNPTYDLVLPLIPEGYYDALSGKSDGALKQAIQDIISNPNSVRAQTYRDVFDILKEADVNPFNSNQVWLVYTEEGRSFLDQQSSSESIGKWNREHTFPRSRGGFGDIKADAYADGKEQFWQTSADSLRHANSDAHAIRAADGPENSSRGNRFYGEYTGPTSNLGSFKGDVARSVLFLDVRYNGLEVVNGYPDGEVGKFGDLQTLLEWHRSDPPDDFEKHRNNVIYGWQYNRNPFIDFPGLVEYLWGNKKGQSWSFPLNSKQDFENEKLIYPNPSQGRVFISGKNSFDISVYGVDGKLYYNKTVKPGWIDLPINSGMYLIKLNQGMQNFETKILIN